MATPKELLDELLKGLPDARRSSGQKWRAQAVDEGADRAHAQAPEGRGSGNSRNGTSAKTIQGDHGEVPLEDPLSRAKRTL